MRTLLAVLAVLLLRGKALLEDDRHLAFLVGIIACRAEIHQLQLAALCQHQVIGADVAVDNALGVNDAQTAHDGQHQRHQLLQLKAAARIDVVLEGLAVEELHDDVGGAVCLEVIQNIHDTLFLGERSDVLRLKQEALDALAEKNLSALRHNDSRGLLVGAVRRTRGIKLLDGDALGERGVQTDIGDAEAAFSENLAHQITSRQHGAAQQVIRRIGTLSCRVVKAAVAAHHRAIQRAHTFITIFLHIDPSYVHNLIAILHTSYSYTLVL